MRTPDREPGLDFQDATIPDAQPVGIDAYSGKRVHPDSSASQNCSPITSDPLCGPCQGSLRFVDLFAGLGGFHLALRDLGHQCVFACEIDDPLATLYYRNFGLRPHGDIRSLNIRSIPAHDVLCAGFPCQPFSKAGAQQGLSCPQWGNLIDYVIDILTIHKPSFFLFENVPNLVRHEHGATWRQLRKRIERIGYSVQDRLLSPHDFGIPQIRQRAFIVGSRDGLRGFSWPSAPTPPPTLAVHSILDNSPTDARRLPSSFVAYLDAWQDFLKRSGGICLFQGTLRIARPRPPGALFPRWPSRTAPVVWRASSMFQIEGGGGLDAGRQVVHRRRNPAENAEPRKRRPTARSWRQGYSGRSNSRRMRLPWSCD